MRAEARAERQAVIGDAVIAVAAEQGIGAVSLRVVAQAAGVSMGAVQHHFGNVPDLVRFGLDRTLAELTAIVDRALAAATDGAEGQAQFRDRARALLADDPRLVELLRAYAQLRTLAARDPHAAAAVAAFDTQHTAALAHAVALGRRRRLLHELVEPEPAAAAYWVLLMSLAMDVALGLRDRAASLATVRAHFRTLARNRRVTRG